MVLPNAAPPAAVASSPTEVLVFVGVCLLTLAGSVVTLCWLCVCRSERIPRAQLAAQLAVLSLPLAPRTPPPVPLHVAIVNQPDGDMALGLRTRPDKKMCAPQQHTQAWEEA